MSKPTTISRSVSVKLPVLLLLLLLSTLGWTRAASTAPPKKWYQRNNPLAKPAPTTTTEDAVPKQQRPGWLQRASSSRSNSTSTTTTTTGTTGTSEDTASGGASSAGGGAGGVWSFFVPGSSSKRNTTDDATSTSPTLKGSGDKKEKRRGGWFQRRSTNTNTTQEGGTKGEEKKDETPDSTTTTAKQEQTSSNTTLMTSNHTTAPSTSTSSETSASPPDAQQQQLLQQQQQQQQQMYTQQTPQGGVVVMGPAPPSSGARPTPTYRYYGRRPQTPGNMPSSSPHQQPSSQGTLVATEIVAQLLGQAMRLWFLTWLARRTQEEVLQPTQRFVWERLNDKFRRDAQALQSAVQAPPLGVSPGRWKRQQASRSGAAANGSKAAGRNNQRRASLDQVFTRTVVVLELNTGGGGMKSPSSGGGGGGSSAIDLEQLSEVITFLLQQQRQHAFGTHKYTGEPMELEVVLMVNSPGGAVATYGLAAAQMQRLSREPHIVTTVCVDKYAASGGYMIASQSDRLIAAPFATIGSVGVIMEGLNFHELAKRYGINPLVIKAGDSKNPLSTWGPVSKRDLEEEQGRLEKVHRAFKELVQDGRPVLAENLEQVTDGSVYLGSEAKELGMIDAVMTTDEYLLERIEAGDRVLRLHRSQQHWYRRQFNLSPLDVLPHLRHWATRGVAKLLGTAAADNSNEDVTKLLVSRLIQAGSWLGFAHHVVRKYGPR